MEARARFRAEQRDAAANIIADCRAALVVRTRGKAPTFNDLSGEAHKALGRARMQGGALQIYFAARAVAYLDAALERTAQQASLLESRATAWAYLRELELCCADFDAVRARRGANFKSLEAQTELFALHFDFRVASEVYREAIRMGARQGRWALSVELCLNRAQSDESRAHHQLAWLDSAVEIAPHDTMPLVERAQWEERAGNSRRALADFDRAIELVPQSPELYQLRAECIANSRAERGTAWFIAASNDYARALRLRIAAGEFIASGLEIYRLAIQNKTRPKDAPQLTRSHAILSVALEYEPHKASFYARRALTLRQLESLRRYISPRSQKPDERLQKAAFNDELRAVQLEPGNAKYRAQLAQLFVAPLQGKSAHEGLEGVINARHVLLEAGLNAELTEAVMEAVQARLSETE